MSDNIEKVSKIFTPILTEEQSQMAVDIIKNLYLSNSLNYFSGAHELHDKAREFLQLIGEI